MVILSVFLVIIIIGLFAFINHNILIDTRQNFIIKSIEVIDLDKGVYRVKFYDYDISFIVYKKYEIGETLKLTNY